MELLPVGGEPVQVGDPGRLRVIGESNLGSGRGREVEGDGSGGREFWRPAAAPRSMAGRNGVVIGRPRGLRPDAGARRHCHGTGGAGVEGRRQVEARRLDAA